MDFFFFLFLKDSTNLNEGQETFLSIRNLTAHTFSWKNQRRNAVLLLVLGNNERHLAEGELGTTGPQTTVGKLSSQGQERKLKVALSQEGGALGVGVGHLHAHNLHHPNLAV